MDVNAIEYYKSLRDQWVIGVRDENAPVLNKMEDATYQLGRGNDLGIDVDLFIQGFDEYSQQQEEITNPFVEQEQTVEDAIIVDAIEDEVITQEEVDENLGE